MVFVEDWETVLSNAGASIARVVTGISFSFLFAVPLGLMIGRYQLLDMMTDWSIQIFRSIPADLARFHSRSCSSASATSRRSR